MASTSGVSNVVIIPTVIIIIAIINTVIVSAVREGELNMLFGVLRSRGYHLFANAVATSDVHYDIKSDGNFTLFAPINSALFALDMTMPASNYVSALRYHVVPRRMSISDLLSLPPGSNSVPTLVPGQDIIVEQRRSLRSLITVGGVDVVVPGIFYGRNIAVHGLDGILEYRPHTRDLPANSTVTGETLSNLSGNVTLQSPIMEIKGNYTFQFPKATPPPPPPSNSTLNQTVKYRKATPHPPPPPLSNSTLNQTVKNPKAAPTTSAVSSSNASQISSVGIPKKLIPSPKKTPIGSASFALRREERIRLSRAKLLELSSDGVYDLSPTTESTSNRWQQSAPMDDELINCPLADNGGDLRNADVPEPKLHMTNMICAQK